MIAGIADMIGLPVIRNDVTGVITDKIIPHAIPAPSAAMIRHALMIGPVMYTLVFLKNWLTIQIASNTAVVVICFVVIFINPPLFSEGKCDCLCRSRGFSSFVLRSKMPAMPPLHSMCPCRSNAQHIGQDFPPLFCTIFATIIVQHL